MLAGGYLDPRRSSSTSKFADGLQKVSLVYQFGLLIVSKVLQVLSSRNTLSVTHSDTASEAYRGPFCPHKWICGPRLVFPWDGNKKIIVKKGSLKFLRSVIVFQIHHSGIFLS